MSASEPQKLPPQALYGGKMAAIPVEEYIRLRRIELATRHMTSLMTDLSSAGGRREPMIVSVCGNTEAMALFSAASTELNIALNEKSLVQDVLA
jgi:hypothetical protein